MSSSSSSRAAERRETWGNDRAVRVRVVATVLFDRELASADHARMQMAALTVSGAMGCRIRGRLALAEFRLVARSVEEAATHVAERMVPFADVAEVFVAAGIPGDDGPCIALFTSGWPEEEPDLATLHAPDALSHRSKANEWRSV